MPTPICTQLGTVDPTCEPLTYSFEFVDASGAVLFAMSGAAGDPANVSIPAVLSGTMENFDVDADLLSNAGVAAIKRYVTSAACPGYDSADTVWIGSDTCCPDEAGTFAAFGDPIADQAAADAAAAGLTPGTLVIGTDPNGGEATYIVNPDGTTTLVSCKPMTLATPIVGPANDEGTAEALAATTLAGSLPGTEVAVTLADGSTLYYEVKPDGTVGLTGGVSATTGAAITAGAAYDPATAQATADGEAAGTAAGTVIYVEDGNGGVATYLSDGMGGANLIGCKSGDEVVIDDTSGAFVDADAPTPTEIYDAAVATNGGPLVPGTVVNYTAPSGEVMSYEISADGTTAVPTGVDEMFGAIDNNDGTVTLMLSSGPCTISAEKTEVICGLNGVIAIDTTDLKTNTTTRQKIANSSQFTRVTLPPNAIVVDANTPVGFTSAEFPVPIDLPECDTRFFIRAVGGMRYVDGVTNRRAQITTQVSFDGGATWTSVSGGEDSFATNPAAYNEIHFSESGASPTVSGAQTPIVRWEVTLNTLTGTTVISNTSITLDFEWDSLGCCD